jgi:hypothetical protein
MFRRENGRIALGLPFIGARHGGDSQAEKAGAPQRRRAQTIGVERIDAIVLGGYIDHVARAAGDGHARHVQGLSIHLAVDRVRAFLAEFHGVDVRRGKKRLGQVLAGAGIVVVPGKHADLSRSRVCRNHETCDGGEGGLEEMCHQELPFPFVRFNSESVDSARLGCYQKARRNPKDS